MQLASSLDSSMALPVERGLEGRDLGQLGSLGRGQDVLGFDRSRKRAAGMQSTMSIMVRASMSTVPT